MRLRDIKKIVSDNLPSLRYEAEAKGSDLVEIKGFQKAIHALNNLKTLRYIEKEFNDISGLEHIYLNKSSDDKVLVNPLANQILNSSLNNIISKSRTILALIDEAIPEESEFSVSIKLPDYRDLPSLSKFFNELDKSLKIVLVNKDINGKVELQNFDSGSLWIEIIVGSSLALDFLAKTVNKALELRQKYHQDNIFKLQAERYGIQNDFLKNIQQTIEQQTDILVKSQVQTLLSETNTPSLNNPENISKLEYSIQILAKFMTEGAEIHPALNSSQEVKDKFPEYPKLQIPEELKELQEPVQENQPELSDDVSE